MPIEFLIAAGRMGVTLTPFALVNSKSIRFC
jgi:hypothetical protein